MGRKIAGGVSVEVDAKTSRFNKGMGAAEKSLGKFGKKAKLEMSGIRQSAKNMERQFGRMAGKINNFAFLIGGAAFTTLIKSSLDAADAIGKTADKLGIQTDQLQELRFAAKQTGVEQNSLDTSLQRFIRRLGEAEQGTGVLKNVLTQYNIEIKKSDGTMRSSMDVLDDYADAIKNASSAEERLFLATRAFDIEGAKLVNTLSRGAAGLADYKDEARAAGLVMEEDLIRKAEIINDRFNKLATTISTTLKSAIISMVDFFSPARDEMDVMRHQMSVFAADIEKINAAGSDTWYQRTFGEINTDKIDEIQLKMDALAAKMVSLSGGGSEFGDGSPMKFTPVMTDDEFETEFDRADQQFSQLNKLYEKSAKAQEKIEAKSSKQLVAMKMGVAQQAVGFLKGIVGESKFAQIAIIALEKGLAIAQTVINTKVAEMRAFADLGPVAGTVAAAKIATLGSISVGIIAATGIAQAGGIGGGGGSGIGGVPVSDTTASAPSAPPTIFDGAQQSTRRELVINVEAGIRDENNIIELVKTINDLAGDGLEVRATVVI